MKKRFTIRPSALETYELSGILTPYPKAIWNHIELNYSRDDDDMVERLSSDQFVDGICYPETTQTTELSILKTLTDALITALEYQTKALNRSMVEDPLKLNYNSSEETPTDSTGQRQVSGTELNHVKYQRRKASQPPLEN